MAKIRGVGVYKKLDLLAGAPLLAVLSFFTRAGIRKQDLPAIYATNIAILTPGTIGDTVLLSALVNALRARGDFSIDLYTMGSATAATFLNVDNVYQIKTRKVFSALLQIRRKHYDIFIDSSQWARITAVISVLSGARLTIGFDTPGQHRAFAYEIKVPHSDNRHEWLNFLALGQAVFPGIYAPPEIAATVKTGYPSKPYIVCHMFTEGSNAEARLWAEEKWSELIKILQNKGFEIVLSGSAADRKKIEAFINKFPLSNISNTAGDFDLHELGGLLACASAVVSVNTGVMHMAALLKTPTVGIHGPTSPMRWGPVGEKTQSVIPDGAKSFLNLGFEQMPDDSAYAYRVEVAQVTAALEKLGIL